MIKIFFILPMRCGAIAALTLALVTSAFGDPGAHGPGGEHLQTPAANTAGGMSQPRVEAKSELFELVAYLGGGELSVMVNRFETNEPVLDGKVEVSSGSLTAAAKFHADHGDYAVDDAAFLKILSASGQHPLIFTIVAGSDTDLLEGTLTVAPGHAASGDHRHSHALQYALIAAGVVGILIVAVVFWRRRAHRRTSYRAGALS